MSRLGLTKVGTLWWIQLIGSLSEEDMRRVAILTGSLGTRPPSKVVLDFSRVRHLDFRGGHLLVAASRLVRLRGGSVTVTGVSPYVWNLLRLGVAQECEELMSDADASSSDGVRSYEMNLVFPETGVAPERDQPLSAGFAPFSPN